ncbi:hypothetical protein [Mycobacterium sp. C31M]
MIAELEGIPSEYLLGAGGTVTLAGLCALGFIGDIRRQRQFYWVSWLCGAVLMSCALVEHGWQMVVLAFAVLVVAAVCYSYFRTSYLKVGGRIFSFWIARTQPDPLPDGSAAPPVIPPPNSYRGMVTATTYWWFSAVVAAAAGVSALTLRMSPVTIGLALFAIVLLAGAGYLDAHDGFTLARRQWTPGAVVVISSIPVFFLPTIAYLIAYYIDKPWRASAESNRDG